MENRNRKSSCCGNDDLGDAAVWTECLRAAVDFLTLGMRQYNRIPSYLIPSIRKIGSVRAASGPGVFLCLSPLPLVHERKW